MTVGERCGLVTRAEIPGVRILGRPFKPLAVGLLLSGFTLAFNTILLYTDQSSLIPIPGGVVQSQSVAAPASLAALVMGLFAAVGIALMVIAWLSRSQRIYEYGLLLSFGAWTARWIGIALDGNAIYAVLPLSMSIMAAGAYWLERVDEHDGMR